MYMNKINRRLQLYICCTNTTKNKQERCIIIQIYICCITPKTLRAEWKWKSAFHSRKHTSLVQLISHRKLKSCLCTGQRECIHQQDRLFDIHWAALLICNDEVRQGTRLVQSHYWPVLCSHHQDPRKEVLPDRMVGRETFIHLLNSFWIGVS